MLNAAISKNSKLTLSIVAQRVLAASVGAALFFSMTVAFSADPSSNLPKSKEGSKVLKIIKKKATDKGSKALKKGINIQPAITAGVQCVAQRAAALAACCELDLPDVASRLPNVSLFEYSCPLGQSGQIPCIENPPDPGEVDRSGQTGVQQAPAACTAALEDYEDQGCFPALANNSELCPEITSSAAQVLPLCGALEAYYDDGKMCDPLGNFDFAKKDTEQYEIGLPGGEPKRVYHPAPDEGEPVDIPGPSYKLPKNHNEVPEKLRLEIPGNFLRFFTARVGIMSAFDQLADSNLESLQCDPDAMVCTLNPMVAGGKLAKAVQKKSNDDSNLNIGFEETHDGIIINHLHYEVGEWGGLGLSADWVGALRIQPRDRQVLKIDLGSKSKMRWLPLHNPNGANGYRTNVKEDHRLDRAKIAAGLTDNELKALRNIRHFDTPNRGIQAPTTIDGLNGHYVTYLTPFSCQSTGARQNFCVWDPYPRESSPILSIDAAQRAVFRLQHPNGEPFSVSVSRSFPMWKTLPLFKSDRETSQALAFLDIVFRSRRNMPQDEREDYNYRKPVYYAPRVVVQARENNNLIQDFTTHLQAMQITRSLAVIDNNGDGRIDLDNPFLMNLLHSYLRMQIDQPSHNLGVRPNRRLEQIFSIDALCYGDDQESRYFVLGDFNNRMTFEEIGQVNGHFPFNDARAKALVTDTVRNFGCAGRQMVPYELVNAERPPNQNGANTSFATTATGLDVGTEIDLGVYQAKFERTPAIGSIGFIAVNIGLSASVESWLKKRWWTSWINWLLKWVMKLLSAVISLLTNVFVHMPATGLLAPDTAVIDMKEMDLEFHAALANASPSPTLQEVSFGVRRLLASAPDPDIFAFNEPEWDTPACDVRDNWSRVEGPVSFMTWLWDTVVGCPIQAFFEVIEVVTSPIRTIFWKITDWIFDVLKLVNNKLDTTVVREVTQLQQQNDIVNLIQTAVVDTTFDPNITGEVANPFAKYASGISSGHTAIFRRLCALSNAPAIGCLAIDIMSAPNFGQGITGCIDRLGAKTHFHSLEDLRKTGRIQESVDFPPVRYCVRGDEPLEGDRQISEANLHEDVLWNFDEIDTGPKIGGKNLGWKTQCAAFVDVKFGGVFEMQGQREFHRIEFNPTKRTERLINNVMTCKDSNACSPVVRDAPIKERATLAACSLASDLWYTTEDNGVITAHNFIEFMGRRGGRRDDLLNQVKGLYCSPQGRAARGGQSPAQCNRDFAGYTQKITQGAEQCRNHLRGVGAVKFKYDSKQEHYPGQNCAGILAQ